MSHLKVSGSGNHAFIVNQTPIYYTTITVLIPNQDVAWGFSALGIGRFNLSITPLIIALFCYYLIYRSYLQIHDYVKRKYIIVDTSINEDPFSLPAFFNLKLFLIGESHFSIDDRIANGRLVELLCENITNPSVLTEFQDQLIKAKKEIRDISEPWDTAINDSKALSDLLNILLHLASQIHSLHLKSEKMEVSLFIRSALSELRLLNLKLLPSPLLRTLTTIIMQMETALDSKKSLNDLKRQICSCDGSCSDLRKFFISQLIKIWGKAKNIYEDQMGSALINTFKPRNEDLAESMIKKAPSSRRVISISGLLHIINTQELALYRQRGGFDSKHKLALDDGLSLLKGRLKEFARDHKQSHYIILIPKLFPKKEHSIKSKADKGDLDIRKLLECASNTINLLTDEYIDYLALGSAANI